VVVDTAAAEAELRSALQEVAEVGGGGGNARVGYGGVAEIELPVEDLREALVHGRPA